MGSDAAVQLVCQVGAEVSGTPGHCPLLSLLLVVLLLMLLLVLSPVALSQKALNHCMNSVLSSGRPLVSLDTSTCCKHQGSVQGTWHKQRCSMRRITYGLLTTLNTPCQSCMGSHAISCVLPLHTYATAYTAAVAAMAACLPV